MFFTFYLKNKRLEHWLIRCHRCSCYCSSCRL